MPGGSRALSIATQVGDLRDQTSRIAGKLEDLGRRIVVAGNGFSAAHEAAPAAEH